MNSIVEPCALCCLPVRTGDASLEWDSTVYRFCCMGCRQVFMMLVESTEEKDPKAFRQTELFKKCMAMGIIPASETDLKNREDGAPETEHPDIEYGEGAADGDRSLKLRINVDGMWCSACSWVIEESLNRSPGIADANCNFSTDTLNCRYDPVKTAPEQIMEVIRHLGYRPSLPEADRGHVERKREFIRFALSAFMAVNIMMLSFSLYSGFVMELSPAAIRKISWPLSVMAFVVLFYGGWPIHRKAWSGLRMGAAGMEALISIGATASYLLSVYNMLAGSLHLYFDTTAMLITLVLLGKTVERRARRVVGGDLGTIFKLQPGKVRMVTPEFPRGRFVRLGQLKTGDTYRVDPDEIVPADGVIIDGTGTVEESFMTGETKPVDRKPGDRLKSGTRVIDASFRLTAEAVGEDSLLGQMIGIMESTLGRKTVLEGKTDRFLKGFVPTVVVLAAGTSAACLMAGTSAEAALIRAVTVLVISCPCALGIAIPLARVAGIALSGREGILVREFSAFEQAGRVNAFVFDKTGTITHGRWHLLEVEPVTPGHETQALSIAAGLEKDSRHFIAAQIRLVSQDRNIQPAPVDGIEHHENGISGIWDGKAVKIGASAFVSDEIEPADIHRVADPVDSDTLQSRVYLCVDGTLHAVFIFGDRVKKDVHQAIGKLKRAGHRVALISGDGDPVTQAVGRKTGFDEAFGSRLPRDKVAFVERLQAEGYTVAMIGDGVNDGPALVSADLGIAVHSGYHLGKEAAEMTLMRGNPSQIPAYLVLAQRINRKIFQNLTFSLLYNIAAIPIAMAGLLNPLLAVCAMILSSLSVTGNTLLLLKKR